MSEIKLNWSSAKVKDAELTVELSGEASSDWKHDFETTVRLLGRGGWGRVRVKKGAVRVEGVAPGSEAEVRFFLESVVEQANASQRSDEAEKKPDDAGATGPDAEMTERFRSYAGDGDSDDERPSD